MRLFRGDTTIRGAFTLIELLIVVAIIAILAAIAVPNFLEAQVRAKVSRAQNDLRTLALGLEHYRIDNNDYPYIQADNGPAEWQMPVGYPLNSEARAGGLTTPVAYIANALRDPFEMESDTGSGTAPVGKTWLYYERLGWGFDGSGNRWNDNGTGTRAVRVTVDGNGTLLGTAPDFNTTDPNLIPTRYTLFSVGPSKSHRVYNEDGSILVRSRWSIYNRYDPTNGTISQGCVLRFPDGLSFP
jgi:prepilin-type N-terminal cleavage/methylation domain-containing protein